MGSPPAPGERPDVPGELQAIGVVVPAHDEEALIGDCLESIADACLFVAADVRICVVVVLDACTDRTATTVAQTRQRWRRESSCPRLSAIEVGRQNVGAARAAGCRHLLDRYQRLPYDQVWLASTDADSTVPANWLTYQTTLHQRGAAGWVGTIDLTDQGSLSDGGLERHRRVYGDWDGPEHPHVHATNLGVRADAYRQVGGFAELPTAEDHDLVGRLVMASLPIVRGVEASVRTSARLDGQAPHGFAGHLRQMQNDEAVQ